MLIYPLDLLILLCIPVWVYRTLSVRFIFYTTKSITNFLRYLPLTYKPEEKFEFPLLMHEINVLPFELPRHNSYPRFELGSKY